ncbi:MAG TPA: MMPL family transporter [Thermomicrobiales bacterium]|nr:MMPL family transporter [Thermomicrobiales bacterium]
MEHTSARQGPEGLLARWGQLAATHPWRVIAVWVVIIAILAAVSVQFRGEYASEFTIPNSETQNAIDLLAREFPAAAGDSATIVFQSDTDITDASIQQQIDDVVAKAAELPGVVSTIGPDQNPMQISPDGHIAYAQVTYGQAASEIPKEDIDELFALVDSSATDTLRVEVGGQVAQMGEFPELGNSEIIGIIVAMVILLVMFGSVIAMGLPIITALIGVGIGVLTVPLLANTFVMNADITDAFLSMMGLGVGIDYALFILNRYRDGLQDGLSVPDAVANATNTAARSVSFAGITVAIGLLGLSVIRIPFVTGLGLTGATVVIASVLVAMFLMPAILGLVGRGILRWRIPGLGNAKEGKESFWFKWAAFIQRRPGIISLVTIAALLLIAWPYTDINLNLSDAGNNPTSMHTRRAYDLMEQGFGPGANGPLLIVLENEQGLDPDQMQAVANSLQQTPGVAAVTPPTPNEQGTTAILQIIPTTGPQDKATADLVTKLRDDVLPAATEGTGITDYVAGSTSATIDLSHKISDRMPLFFAVVIGLSVVVLIVVFRSLVVPIKAALTTLLSVGAAFGALVAVFQWGWFDSLLGVDSTGPIESFLPMILFGVLFGLSMDYEMFLLSRVHEEHTHGRNAKDAMRYGMGYSAKVVAAAGAIMAAVFLSFVLGDLRMLQEIGFGLGIAVVFDAFIVRLILVPAIMTVLDERAWWFPRWLDRITPRINVEGRPDLVEEEHLDATPVR